MARSAELVEKYLVSKLLALQAWVKNYNTGNKEVEAFIGDAIRFAQAYGGVMEMSILKRLPPWA